MITLTREEAQQVLDALEDVIDDAEEPHKTKNAFEFLRAKLSEPEPEPVAHLWECLGRWSAMLASDGEHADLSPPSWLCDAIKSATTPPQREWQGLTDEEKKAVYQEAANEDWTDIEVINTVEAKLKEKNG